MRYHYQQGMVMPFVNKYYKQLILAVTAIFMSSMALMTAISSAAVVNVVGCDFDQVGSTWTLQSNCVSTGQINVPAGTTVEGGGFTISPNWTRIDNSNNTVLAIINADGVTVNNLTIDGTNGTNLHGIQAYVSENVVLNDVTILSNDRVGLLVNGSTVTVEDISTGSNGWSGINVDQGSGVTEPAILTVNGVSEHTDAAQIYVDHYLAGTRDVVDTNGQYTFMDNPADPNNYTDDRLYTLEVVVPETVTVTINKYVDGVQATAVNANNAAFPMLATYSADNIGSGTNAPYDLDADGFNGDPTPYQAITSEMTEGADYSTNEVTGGSVVGTTCVAGGAPFMLVGYTTGSTLAEAQTATPSATVPAFTDLQENKYVIVWNKTCKFVTNKDECKNGGWMLGLADGRTFKNQGDCVSFYATKQKNQPAGTTTTNARTR